MKIKQVTTGKRFKREAVFILLICSRNNEPFGQKMMLMQMRRDGRMGFPGGMVDEGESLTTALDREVKEELNLEINTITLKPFCSHLIAPGRKKELATHLFHKNVTEEEMKEIISNSVNSLDYIKENMGNFLIDLKQYNHKYNNLLMRRSGLATSVREELELVFKYFG